MNGAKSGQAPPASAARGRQQDRDRPRRGPISETSSSDLSLDLGIESGEIPLHRLIVRQEERILRRFLIDRGQRLAIQFGEVERQGLRDDGALGLLRIRGPLVELRDQTGRVTFRTPACGSCDLTSRCTKPIAITSYLQAYGNLSGDTRTHEGYAAASRTRTSSPPASPLRALTVPPMRATRPRTRARPMPVPFVVRVSSLSPRQNGSKMWRSWRGATPGPRSARGSQSQGLTPAGLLRRRRVPACPDPVPADRNRQRVVQSEHDDGSAAVSLPRI